MALPISIIRMVEASGCETPADWKFAVLKKPEDEAEAFFWDAVQSAGALDVGAMMVIAAQASAKRQGKCEPSSLQGVLKPQAGQGTNSPLEGPRS